MTVPKAVYRVLEPLPELDAQPGDHVVVAPADPLTPLAVVKRHSRHTLTRLMGAGHLGRMRLVAGKLMPDEPPAAPSGRALTLVR